jgi:hypothetical protein
MNKGFMWRILALIALASGLSLRVHAQSFDLSWFTIDGGGGASTGGVYSVTGTIGQPDTGHMSGGSYSIDGGFWGLLAVVQSPGAPLLRIRSIGTNAVISWPMSATGFVLQQNSSLLASNAWTSSGLPGIVVTNGTNTVTVPANSGNKFFRLRQ